MGSGASFNVENMNKEDGTTLNAMNMEDKKRLLLYGTKRFFELDEKHESYLDIDKINILIADILADYNHAFISKEEIRKRILHKIHISTLSRMNMPDFFTLFEEW